MVKHYKNKRKRRHLRVRSKVKGTATRPRLSVFRSNKHIYAQIIDDEKGKTLIAASDIKPANTENTEKFTEAQREGNTVALSASAHSRPPSPNGEAVGGRSSALQRLKVKYSKTEIAKLVGQELAKRALKLKVKSVVFDRGGYKYHGRVKALAEGAREGGLEF